MTAREASCSCGQLRARVSADPIRVSVCHCLACQRRTGSAFGTQARFPREHVELIGDATVFERRSDEDGAWRRFRFCPTCGASVAFELEGADDAIAIPMGAFADPQFPPPILSIWEERQHAWVSIAEVEHIG